MTGGELALAALLVRLEEREREIAAQAETARESSWWWHHVGWMRRLS
jgi:hypothetical protein